MKIRRFNEKNSEYLTVEDIRDLFLFMIEDIDMEIDLCETTFLDDNNGGHDIDTGNREYWNKKIECTTLGINTDFLPFHCDNGICRISMKQFKEFYDEYYLRFSEISEDIAKKGYIFNITGIPGIHYTLEIEIIKNEN